MAKMPFQVIPVIDVLNGHAVHAVAGRRAYYQPIQSILHATSEPVPIARALRDSLGSETLYLADLDAIAGCPPKLEIYREVIASGFHLWVDAGVRNVKSVSPLLELDRSFITIIAGLETVSGPRELAGIVNEAGAERVVFSLDLFEGRPRIAAPAAWRTDDPHALARAAIECGVCDLLILDLARVGTGQGLGTQNLMNRIREGHRSVRLSVGGGISRIEEVVDLQSAGARAVLIGSAIHDGRIGASELQRLEISGP
jgi:phosphoribosylformimino-5-aminoimidazole carboxamide ribotide isomerase